MSSRWRPNPPPEARITPRPARPSDEEEEAESEPSQRISDPGRRTMTTLQEISYEASQRAREIEAQHADPPRVAALLELIAADMRRSRRDAAAALAAVEEENRQTREAIVRVDRRIADRERKERRAFNWLKFLGALGSGISFFGLVWGEWVKTHPVEGASGALGWATAVFAALNAKRLLAGAQVTEAKNEEGNGK